MKMFFYCFVFIAVMFPFSYSQQSRKPEVVGKEISSSFEINIPENPVEQIKNDPSLPAEDQLLLNKINEIKFSNDPSLKDELEQLLKTFNNRNGLIEMRAEPYNGKIIYPDRENFNSTLNNITKIYPMSVRSFATATIQSGTDRGTVWVALTHNANELGTGPDTLALYWTDDGINYHIYAQAILDGTDVFAWENLDMEIIEKTSGDKYIWVFFTYMQLGTIRKIGCFKQPIAQEWGTMFALFWPGQTNDDRYYNVRITSDNSLDSSSTWLYIACSVNTTGTGGNLLYGQKFAYITQTTQLGIPTVTYRTAFLPVTWQSGDQYNRFLYSDIAYYYNQNINASRLMFTYSNIPDSTKIWLSECSITGTDALFRGTLGTSFYIQNSVIAAPGGTGNSQLLVVANQNWDNNGDWDLITFKTNNSGGSWESVAIEGSISTSELLPSFPDICCKRGDVNNYRVSYNLGHFNINWVPDSIMYIESGGDDQNTWNWPGRKVNSDITFQAHWYSRVGFIGSKGDDCFVLWRWNDTFVGGLYSTSCFIPTDVNDNQFIPAEYSLSNNYPNPFNPITHFDFSVADFGFVSLKVYDLLGREVAILVNEEKHSGKYEISFDASNLSSGVYYYRLQTDNYTETKKMILLK